MKQLVCFAETPGKSIFLLRDTGFGHIDSYTASSTCGKHLQIYLSNNNNRQKNTANEVNVNDCEVAPVEEAGHVNVHVNAVT